MLHFFIGKLIVLEAFETHYISYIISDNEEVSNNCIIYSAHFSGLSVNVTNVATDKKMLYLKQVTVLLTF